MQTERATNPLQSRVTRDDRTARFVWWLVVAPIILAALITAWWSIDSLQQRLRMPFPQNPWESSIVADAWRFAHGQPVYERLPRGHATHMYGPLTSATIGVIFKITGAMNFYVGRTITLVCALASCAILLLIYVPRRNLVAIVIAAGLMLGLHYRGRAYFVETRPDMIALLFATLAMLLFCRAHLARKWLLYLPGIALTIIAMLYKQTYACAAGVPVTAVVLSFLQGRIDAKALRKDALIALAPLFAVIATLGAMKLFTPVIFFYTITEPAMYEIRTDRLGLAGMSLFMLSPLFVALMAWYGLTSRDGKLSSAKMTWLIAAACVGCAASIPAYAKRGGSYNSLLLGFVPTTVFCCAMIDPLLRRLREMGSEIGAVGIGWFAALLLLITTFCVPNSDLWNFGGAHGGSNYAAVVAATSQLPGRVISPDDPTILMLAKGEACRSLEAELDATNRPPGMPTALAGDIAKARWLIRVHGNYDAFYTNEMITNLGFERVPVSRAPAFKRYYSLWQRARPPTTQATSAPFREKRRSNIRP